MILRHKVETEREIGLICLGVKERASLPARNPSEIRSFGSGSVSAGALAKLRSAKRTAIPKHARGLQPAPVNLNLPFMVISQRGTCAWVQANPLPSGANSHKVLCTSTKMHDRRSFNWDDLKPFLAVARAGSTLGAAKLLGVSQPTVQRRIAALEKSLGCQLWRGARIFDRCRVSKTAPFEGAVAILRSTAIRGACVHSGKAGRAEAGTIPVALGLGVRPFVDSLALGLGSTI